MGEEVTKDLDLGTESIDASEVLLPTEEVLTGIDMQLTDEQKWQRFQVHTSHRELSVEPGTVGDNKFAAFCTKVKAMYSTAEGQAVLEDMKALLKTKKLALNVTITEVAPEEPLP
jgi:hypothetical protein